MEKLKVIGIGIIFLAVGAFMFFKGQEQAKNCTVEATGTVVEIAEDISTDSDGNFSYTYFPVIEYNAGEKVVKKQSSSGSNPSKYSTNDKVEILYNPNNVEEYIIKGDKSSNLFGIGFMALGAIILVLGIAKKF